MAGRGGKTKSGRSSRAQKSDGPAVEVLSEENTSDDLPEHPSKVQYSFGSSNKLWLLG